MSRLANTYLAPGDTGFASMTPILPMEALGEVLSRVSAAIPQGAWLEGSPDLLLDKSSNALKLKLTDGSFVPLHMNVFDLSQHVSSVVQRQDTSVTQRQDTSSATQRQDASRCSPEVRSRNSVLPDRTGVEPRPSTEKNGVHSLQDTRAVVYTLDTRGVQTSEADIPVGQGHQSLLFPAIEEMVQAITAAENRASFKRH